MWRRVWIWKRKAKKGVTYYVRWRDQGGRVRSESIGTDRKLAERLRSQREVEINSRGFCEVAAIPYDEFVQEELVILRGRVSPGTVDATEIALRHLRRIGCPRQLADVSTAMVEKFLTVRLREVAKATANKDLRHLKASLNRAVRRGYMLESPAAPVRQVRVPEKRLRILSAEEIRKLLGACLDLRWEAFIVVALATGMRRGEILALRWQDVDFKEGTIWVGNTDTHETKSKRNRVLGLVPEAAAALQRLPRSGNLVFMSDRGNPWGNNIRVGFLRLLKRAGIPYCTMHDLRRTFISHLAMAGVNAAIVQELAGHSSISTTLKHYTRIMPQSLRDAQRRLEYASVLGGVSNSSQLADSGPNEKTARAVSAAHAVG
jgi:integrase